MRKAATSPGIAGNDLNRCEVRALQRKDVERTAKEQLYSLVDSRLRVVGMSSGGQKRKAFSAHAKPSDKEKHFSA